MIGFIAYIATSLSAIPYDAKDTSAASTWIRQAGHGFDPDTLSPENMDALLQRVGPADLIGIGEATHGTHQDQAFKAELVKRLISRDGTTTLILECNRSAAEAFDRYVVQGDGDPAALIQSPRFFFAWKNDVFASLLVWLRAWNMHATQPVRIVGVDNQDSAVDAATALAFVDKHNPTEAVSLRRVLSSFIADPNQQFFGWVQATDPHNYRSIQNAVARMRDMFTDAPASWHADPDFAVARYASETAWQGLYIFERDYKGSTENREEMAYLGRRDQLMMGNISAVLSRGRGIFWAHDMHVAHGASKATMASGYRPVGSYLRERLGYRYRTIGFTWSKAVVRAVPLRNDNLPLPAKRVYEEIPLRNDMPGALGHVFATMPANGWWVDVTARPHTAALDRWGSTDIFHGFVGWGLDPSRFDKEPAEDMTNPPDVGFDILVWFRTMTPSRALPAARPSRPR